MAVEREKAKQVLEAQQQGGVAGDNIWRQASKGIVFEVGSKSNDYLEGAKGSEKEMLFSSAKVHGVWNQKSLLEETAEEAVSSGRVRLHVEQEGQGSIQGTGEDAYLLMTE